ncbi:nuclear transport factor 2 family protein [Methylocapsa sp. S129]|uniref:nuclear transport factor 2 family protein n=1 Tax=Methylocapsa sp. S129 TaxID=1641869 RepID=UPI00131E5184|nr:nuclear transport factor 2 family protein [Methylocapsa sp. S129]
MTDPAVQALLDKDAIRECLFRYCRGIDRQDEEALRASYWPDATDRHGPYSGSAEGFIAWALAALKKSERSVHMIGNIAIALSGSVAAVESYFSALQRGPDASGRNIEVFLAGRYVDRFEKRGDEWRVAARTVVYDWIHESGAPKSEESERFGVRKPQGGAKPHDPYYDLLAQMTAQR